MLVSDAPLPAEKAPAEKALFYILQFKSSPKRGGGSRGSEATSASNTSFVENEKSSVNKYAQNTEFF